MTIGKYIFNSSIKCNFLMLTFSTEVLSIGVNTSIILKQLSFIENKYIICPSFCFFLIHFITHPIAMNFAKKIKHSLLFNFNLNSTTSQGFDEMILQASNSQNYQRDSTIKDSFYMYAILYMRGRENFSQKWGHSPAGPEWWLSGLENQVADWFWPVC